MKITHQFISSYPVLSTARFMKAFPKALAAATLVLSLGLAACTSDVSSVSSSDQPTAQASDSAADGVAADSANASAGSAAAKIYVKDGVAIGGADPVAYFNSDLAEGDFVEGSADYTHEWAGATWQFASAENRDAFAANPEQYAPQYGGYCAWAAAQNAIAAISPDAWSVVDGRLYLNANKKIQARWEKDIAGFIAKANENWPTLSMQ